MSAFLDSIASPFASTLFVVSLQFAAVFLVVLALDATILRKATPRLRLALWAAALLPLAVPLRWPALSLPSGDEAQVVADAAPNTTERRSRSTGALPLSLSTDTIGAEKERFTPVAPSQPSTERTAEPSTDEPSVVSEPSVAEPASASAPAIDEADPAPLATTPWTATVSPFLLLLWAAGALVVLVRATLAERRLRRALREAPAAPERVRELAGRAQAITGLRRELDVRTLDALATPAVHGVRRPRLIVPSDAEALDDDQLLTVLVHESFHVHRGDLWWAPLVALIRAAWWFHPLVHHATRRLADALEEARDHDALQAITRHELTRGDDASSDPSPARLAYARLLVQLAERRSGGGARPVPHPVAPGAIPLTRDGRGLARRIEMIVTHPRPRPIATFSLGGVALALAAFGFAGTRPNAPPTDANAPDRPTEPTATPEGVVVERPGDDPAWRKELEAKLATSVEVLELSGTPRDVFTQLAGVHDLPIRIDGDTIDDYGYDEATIRMTNATLRDVLDFACKRFPDFEWSVADGAIFVGAEGDVPLELELRFYRIAPIVTARATSYDDIEQLVSELAHLEGSTTPHDYPLDREGVSLHVWRDLLAVKTWPEHHDSIKAFLDRLLSGERHPARVEEPWRAPLEGAISATIAPAGEVECGELLEMIQAMVGIPILFEDGDPDDDGQVFDLSIGQRTARQVLDEVARRHGRFVRLDAGGIILSHYRELETQLHPIEALLRLDPDYSDDLIDDVVQFARDIDASSWDEDPSCSVVRCGNRLVVRQTRETQDEIARLIAQIERALGGAGSRR